jgi:DNA-3-methyladenine glycosylase II
MVMSNKFLVHFQTVDPLLYSLFNKYSLPEIKQENPKKYFSQLCGEIIGQQLSGKVADVICARFEMLFPGKRVTPVGVLNLSEEKLRLTGMSWSKVSFIRDLAQQILTKSIQLDQLARLSDMEVIATLTKVKGIGPWTAEMFLMFTLGREDVFSYGDLGLRNAIKRIYGFKKDPSVRQMQKIVNAWKPYRTYAARILWKSLERS